jgi:NtrC-family two-component system sensor histidine kinase KinB
VGGILDNLLSNAIRHSGHNGQVVVSVVERDHRLFTSVKDTSEGIPEEYLSTLFSRFIQVGAKPGGGTGLDWPWLNAWLRLRVDTSA